MPLRTISAALLLAVLTLTPMEPAMAIEEPAYEVLERDDRIELRAYAPLVVAETVVDGDLSTATNRGFRAIAAYIFGANRSVRGTGTSEKIEMTAPVVVEPASQRIAMTAPVTVEPQASDTIAGAARWRVQFVMPKEYRLDTLPRPDDPTVTLREVPGVRRAVLRFSGLAGEDKVSGLTTELRAWIGARRLTEVGAPQLARYDPPWTLPFLRRNEVMIEVTPAR
jgi:hypothetical protein